MRPCRQGRLRQPLVRRAPLPNGILGLAVSGSPARRAQPDDPADPDRLRRLHPAVPSSGPRRRARRHAGPAHRRSARVRHGSVQRLRADRSGHRSSEHARDVGRVDHDDPANLAIGGVLLGGNLLEGAEAPRAAEAASETAPAHVSRVHADRELRRGGGQGHRRPVVGHLRHEYPRRARQALSSESQAGDARRRGRQRLLG